MVRQSTRYVDVKYINKQMDKEMDRQKRGGWMEG
jgi:hypothetical protein